MRNRVVITGVGVVSPIGIGRQEYWNNLLAGHTGIREITLIDASSYPSKLAAEVPEFDVGSYIPRRKIGRFSRATQFAVVAAILARDDARLREIDPYRTDIILGTATCSFDSLQEAISDNPTLFQSYDPTNLDPLAMLKTFSNGPACAVALELNTKGNVETVTTACASGVSAIGNAYRTIRSGDADVVFAGAVDTPINHFVFSSFCSVNFISTAKTPQEAACPFDERRTRRTLGEGACVVVLEDLDHALARGAKIYAEITEYFQSTENVNELYTLDRTGAKWAEHIDRTMRPSKNRQLPDYICAHAPSDKHSDLAESRAIDVCFGKKGKKIPVSSIKGSIGQGFSSAGALQVAATALAIESGIIPGTTNFRDPDAECEVNVTQTNRSKDINLALVNAHGLGGINASLLLKKVKL